MLLSFAPIASSVPCSPGSIGGCLSLWKGSIGYTRCASRGLRDALGIPIPPVELTEYERSLSATRVHLGERAFAAAWAQGRAMTTQQALAAQGHKPTPTPSATPSPQAYPAGLTAREVEVLNLLAGGLTDQQIADKLVLSPRTVHAHISSIYSKLAVTSRSAATRYAIEHHLA